MMDPVRQAAREATMSRSRSDQLRIDLASLSADRREAAAAAQEAERVRRRREALAQIVRAEAEASARQTMDRARKAVTEKRLMYLAEREGARQDRNLPGRMMEAFGVKFERSGGQQDLSSSQGGSAMDKGAEFTLEGLRGHQKQSTIRVGMGGGADPGRMALVGVSNAQDPESMKEWMLTTRPARGGERALSSILSGGLGGAVGGLGGTALGRLLSTNPRTANLAGLAGLGLGSLFGGVAGARPYSVLEAFDTTTGAEATRAERNLASRVEEALDPGREPANFNAGEGREAGLQEGDFGYAIDIDEALQEDPMLADALSKGAHVTMQKISQFDQAGARLERAGHLRKAAQAKDTALALLEKYVAAQRKNLARYL